MGQLVEHERLDDGRYNLVLKGRWRVRVLEEDRSRSFRVARVRVLASASESFADSGQERLRTLQELLGKLTAAGVADARMVAWLAPSSPCPESLVDAVAAYLLPAGAADESECCRPAPPPPRRSGARMGLGFHGLRRPSISAQKRTAWKGGPTLDL